MSLYQDVQRGMRRVVESANTSAGRFFDLCIQVTILVALVSYALETLPEINADQRRLLQRIELLSITIFTCEYFLRIWVAQPRTSYIFSFYGLVDFFAIAPFYFSLGVDLRSLRAIRFLRVFSIMKLMRFSKAIRRIGTAFSLAKGELVLYLSFSCVVIFIAGTGIYQFEHAAQPDIFSSIPASLWWAIVTLTTVGYGDMLPITAGGRVFTVLILMVGLGLVAVPAGIVSSALSEARRLEEEASRIE